MIPGGENLERIFFEDGLIAEIRAAAQKFSKSSRADGSVLADDLFEVDEELLVEGIDVPAPRKLLRWDKEEVVTLLVLGEVKDLLVERVV